MRWCRSVFVTCVLVQATDANTAQVVKVVPTPNNGYTELLKLHKQKVYIFFLLLVNDQFTLGTGKSQIYQTVLISIVDALCINNSTPTYC